jgi:hypothetical protein
MLSKSPFAVGKSRLLFPAIAMLVVSVALAADPYVSPTLSEKMKALTHGLQSGRSLVLSVADIKDVDFRGAAAGSNTGSGPWMSPGGAWLDLKNFGHDTWGNATVQLQRPIPISRYNSIVLWVKSSTLGARFWLDMQDDDWQKSDASQARTDSIVANAGLPNQCVQIVIPYRAFHYDGSFNFRKLRRIVFDIGQDSTGNM